MRDCVHPENLEHRKRYVRSQNIIENKQKKPPTNRPTTQKENAFVAPVYETMYFKSPWISSDTFLGEDKLFI